MGQLGNLYKTALDKAISTQAKVFAYDDPNDFSALWSEAKDGSPWLDRSKPIVIIWDGDPESSTSDNGPEKQLANHLTPLDWALAFSNKFLQIEAPPRADFRIHILDLTGNEHEAWAIRMRHTLLAEMPWIVLHAPLIMETETSGKCAYRHGYLPIVGGLLESDLSVPQLKLTGKHPTIGASRTLKDLAKQWAATLTHSDDHHDINNVFGARVLLKALTTGRQFTPQLQIDAFLSRLAWCDCIPEPPKGLHDQLKAAVGALSTHSKASVDILIVDDMLSNAWDKVVAEMFGIRPLAEKPIYSAQEFTKLGSRKVNQYAIEMYGAASPMALIDKLLFANFEERTFDFRFGPFGADSKKNPEILLLDVRLFVERSRGNFHSFIKMLWEGIREKVSPSRDWQRRKLAWPSLADDAAVINAWISGEPLAEVPLAVLTLLPRVISLAYPLLPIIIFSSTGRSDIKEKLKPYRNVFTGFEKPRVMSSPETLVSSISELTSAIKSAGSFLAASRAFAEVARYTKQEEVIIPAWKSKNPPVHFEIFLDEVGSEGDLRSVATVIAFDSSGSADKFQDEIQTEVVRAHSSGGKLLSPSWVQFGDDGYDRRLRKLDYRKSEAQLHEGVATLSKFFSNVTAFSVTIGQRTLPLGPARLDATYDRMLRLAIELIVHGLLPVFGVTGRSTWKVFLPQREVPVADESSANDLLMNWGIEWDRNGKKVLAKTYPAGSYYPFLREISFRWPGTEPELLSGRGLRLNYFEYRSARDQKAATMIWPRWIAGLADWVAFASNEPKLRKILQPIVQDIGLRSQNTPLPALEGAIEGLRQLSVPTGNNSLAVTVFLSSWERFRGSKGRIPKVDDSRIAHAVYTQLLSKVMKTSGEHLIAGIQATDRVTTTQTSGYSGNAEVVEVHIPTNGEEDTQFIVVELENKDKVVLSAPPIPIVKIGATLQTELHLSDGEIQLENGVSVNLFRVLPAEGNVPSIDSEKRIEVTVVDDAANSVAVVSVGTSSPTSGIQSANDILELTVLHRAGHFFVLQRDDGIRYAIRCSWGNMPPGQVVRCVETGIMAEVDFGKPKLSVVREVQ